MTSQNFILLAAVLVSLAIIAAAAVLVVGTWKDGAKRTACLMVPIPLAALALTIWYLFSVL